MMPGNQIALLIKSCRDTIEPHRPVVTSPNVGLASPDYFHRLFHCFCNMYCLNNKIRMGISTTAKPATQQGCIKLDLFWFESCNACCCIPVCSLELGSCPDFAAIISKINKTI